MEELEQDDPGGCQEAINGKEGKPRASSPRHLSVGALGDGCLVLTCSGMGEVGDRARTEPHAGGLSRGLPGSDVNPQSLFFTAFKDGC